ncbi:MAG: hypothetical protein HY736_04320, partial [Verrucomicrobia bacterium]|nr:hypothetical protein [Verrucomicrobiota bacterium]
RGALEQDTIHLRKKESRRFAASGVSEVQDREKKFARFAQLLAPERFSPGIGYVHWSFDETDGDLVKAKVAGRAGRPAEGPIGALRTDFGGGNAMDTTSLRDGKWHHVATYFFAGEDPDTPVQVKQYVDGRLESSTIVPGKTRAPAEKGDAAIVDVVWLGCRLSSQTRREHSRGELDELFIADRALDPNEIVALTKYNRPPAATFAGVP